MLGQEPCQNHLEWKARRGYDVDGKKGTINDLGIAVSKFQMKPEYGKMLIASYKYFCRDEIAELLDKAIADSGASGMQDMGKVMSVLKPLIQGRADMGEVSQLVKSKLA